MKIITPVSSSGAGVCYHYENRYSVYIAFIIKNSARLYPGYDSMSILINGSLCLTDMVAKLREGHSAFKKAKNGKVYVNVTEWVNDDPDQYGNHASFLLNSTKEKKEAEGKVYIGNGKKSEASGGSPITESDADALSLDVVEGDGLPF